MKRIFYRIKQDVIILSLIFIFGTAPAWAGPNSSAGCALDLNYETRNYDAGITSKDIETAIEGKVGDEIWVGVIAQNVSNLDTYQAEVLFEADRLSYVEGYEDNTFAGIKNLLKINGGTTIGFQAVENTPGKVNIANALTGINKDQAPEGSGIIALLKFKILSCGSDIPLTLSNVKYMDSDGSNEPLVIDEIVSFTNAVIDVPESPAGDINRNCETDLADVVLALQVSAGITPNSIVHISVDIDGDKKIGIPEAVNALRILSETR